MKIIGIGTDLVHQPRIVTLYHRFGRKLVLRILSKDEIVLFENLSENQRIAFLAKRFAAKEAIAKSLGTGIGKISFKEISVTNAKSGKPIVTISNENMNNINIMVSLSDENDYALAFAIAMALE